MDWINFKKTREEKLKEEGADRGIIPLLKAINAKRWFATSSSCSGRIVLLEIKEGKGDAFFYRKWHRKVTAKEVNDAIGKYEGRKELWFRCEPFILHLFAMDLESAKTFLAACKNAGIKRGGISSLHPRVFMEVIGTHGFALPIYDGRALVNRDYIDYVVSMANRKMELNSAQLGRLHKEIKKKGL